MAPHFTNLYTSSLGDSEQTAMLGGAALASSCCLALILWSCVSNALRSRFWKLLKDGLPEEEPAVKKLIATKLREDSVNYMQCINFFMVSLCFLGNTSVIFNTVANKESRWLTFYQDMVWLWAAAFYGGSHFFLMSKPSSTTTTMVYIGSSLATTAAVSLGPADRVALATFALAMLVIRLVFSVFYDVKLPVIVIMTGINLVCIFVSIVRADALTADCSLAHSSYLSLFVWAELAGDTAALLIAVAWRRFSAFQILHEIRASISQGEKKAVGKLLNTVCDATVELDANLCVVDEEPRLAGMLQHGVGRSLKGTPFRQFVVEDGNSQPFESKIMSASDGDSLANVFNLDVRDSIGNVLQLEAFHVPVASYVGSLAHLLGLREHIDHENAPSPLPPPGVVLNVRSAPSSTRVQQRTPSQGSKGSLSSLPSSLGSPAKDPVEYTSESSSDVVVWFDVLSDCLKLARFSGCIRILWGCGPPSSKDFLSWIAPDARETWIAWVQSTCTELRRCKDDPANDGQQQRRWEDTLLFRPPLLRGCSAMLSASVTLTLHTKADKIQARMTFGDIRLV